jgi:hypothetical protein
MSLKPETQSYRETVSAAPRNLPRRLGPADAPREAGNRALRKKWAALATDVLRRTGDPDTARVAACMSLIVALDTPREPDDENVEVLLHPREVAKLLSRAPDALRVLRGRAVRMARI